MSETDAGGFAKFVPGFDFLQNLAKGASQTIPQLPNLANWVAPTLNVEELEKRIEELKAVHFWLEQNTRALGATVQALEVQKMTLATLKGMNFNMGDVANALKLKAADTVMSGAQKVGEKALDTARTLSEVATGTPPKRKRTATKTAGKATGTGASEGNPMVDPMQWWGSLTQQFQQIAATAMKDAAKQTAIDTTKNLATGLAKTALRGAAATVAGKAASRKTPARKR